MSNLSPMRRMRIVLGVVLAAATLTVLISRSLEDPDLEFAIASAIAADHRLEHPLIEVALEQYPKQGPDIIITYGHLPLFQKQLERFGPQVVPIVAAYQQSFTTEDALQRARAAMQGLQDFLADLPQLGEEALQALRQATNDFLQSLSTPAWALVEPGADAPEIPEEAPDPAEEQAPDRGLIAPLLDRLASWFESAQRLIALLLDWLASWFTSEQRLVAPAAAAPEITGKAADPNEGQAAAENGWLPSWLTPAQRLVGAAADAPGIRQAPDPDEKQAVAENDTVELYGLSEEGRRGLIALANMHDQGNAFVGQWEITAAGEARRVPSRVVILAGPELLIGGLTELERRIVQEREVGWQTYGLAAVDVAAIATGVTLVRFAGTAARATRVAAGSPTLRSGALEATAKVLGIAAVRYGLPIGLVVLMALHPGVFTHYLWLLAESLGMPGIIGPLIGWGIVIVPLAFLLSWMLLSVRLLGFAGWLLAGAARGCRHLAVRLAVPDRRRL